MCLKKRKMQEIFYRESNLENKEGWCNIEFKTGDNVKVTENKERFWLIVLYKKDDEYLGIVNNKLLCNNDYKYGDIIKFKAENVIDVEAVNMEEAITFARDYNDRRDGLDNVQPIHKDQRYH